MRELNGNSSCKRALLSRQGAGTISSSVKNDITRNNLESIFEEAEDLFT